MEPQFEIEALKYVEGPLYTKHRDAWLRSTPNARDLLRRYEQSHDWHNKVTAKILLAWLDHRPEAEKLLARADHEDWDKERNFRGGNLYIPQSYAEWTARQPELHGWVLPLCWEAALKRRKEWPDEKRRIFFAALKLVPNELTIEVMFWFLRALAENDNDRSLALSAIALMPPAMIKPHLVRMERDHEDTLKLFKNNFSDLFLNGPLHREE